MRRARGGAHDDDDDDDDAGGDMFNDSPTHSVVAPQSSTSGHGETPCSPRRRRRAVA
jgi:hypothetical protein